jgi:hypothetical protein
VIVSLKDGMFNNANVLFRTKLIDGISTVQRYGQKKRQIQEKEKDGNDRSSTNITPMSNRNTNLTNSN